MQARASLDIVTEEQFESLMSVIPINQFISVRDRAILSLMFYAGLKEGEILNLTYKDFTRLKGKVTHVLVRGNHERKIVLPEEAEKVNNELLLYEELYGRYKGNIAFHTYCKNKYGEAITDGSSIRRKLSSWSKKSGVNTNATMLRDSYGVGLINEGATVERLAYNMGLKRTRLRGFLAKYAQQLSRNEQLALSRI